MEAVLPPAGSDNEQNASATKDINCVVYVSASDHISYPVEATQMVFRCHRCRRVTLQRFFIHDNKSVDIADPNTLKDVVLVQLDLVTHATSPGPSRTRFRDTYLMALVATRVSLYGHIWTDFTSSRVEMLQESRQHTVFHA